MADTSETRAGPKIDIKVRTRDTRSALAMFEMRFAINREVECKEGQRGGEGRGGARSVRGKDPVEPPAPSLQPPPLLGELSGYLELNQKTCSHRPGACIHEIAVARKSPEGSRKGSDVVAPSSLCHTLRPHRLLRRLVPYHLLCTTISFNHSTHQIPRATKRIGSEHALLEAINGSCLKRPPRR